MENIENLDIIVEKRLLNHPGSGGISIKKPQCTCATFRATRFCLQQPLARTINIQLVPANVKYSVLIVTLRLASNLYTNQRLMKACDVICLINQRLMTLSKYVR